MSNDRKAGTITRLVPDRVFGFIHCPEDVRDYFFHQAQLENCTFGQLAEGDSVSFVAGEGPKGKIEAQEIRREDREHVAPPGHETRAQVGLPEYKPKRRR
jgi:CspA family cold shock protein